MVELIKFHFEGALAEKHRMNFYEAARFQYAAARLMVKLGQFRNVGKVSQKITRKNNLDIQLITHAEGSFNINIEDSAEVPKKGPFLDATLTDLLAFVSDELVGKIDESDHEGTVTAPTGADTSLIAFVDNLADLIVNDLAYLHEVPSELQDVVKRRVAELYRERRLSRKADTLRQITTVRRRKLIAATAPLFSQMAIALRRSADTLEVHSSVDGLDRPLLYLNQTMASEIETAKVDDKITTLLGDIEQFNKQNGWGKFKFEGGTKTVSFNIPYHLLDDMKQRLIDMMKVDLVNLQTYCVRDATGEIVRLIAVGILPTPQR